MARAQGGGVVAPDPASTADSVLVLALLLLRRPEAAGCDGGEGAGVRSWVCCDGVPRLGGSGKGVGKLWGRGGGGTMQLHF